MGLPGPHHQLALSFLLQPSTSLHTCLVVKHPFHAELAGDHAIASIWDEGAFPRADGSRVLLDVAVLRLLVPRQPRGPMHRGGYTQLVGGVEGLC